METLSKRRTDKTVKRLIKKGFVKKDPITNELSVTPNGIVEMMRRGLI